MIELTQNFKPCTRGNLEAEIMGDEIFLYDATNDDAVHRLNNGAALIWILCDGSREVDEIVREITSGFELDQEEVQSQVRMTIANFQRLNLLEPHEGYRSSQRDGH